MKLGRDLNNEVIYRAWPSLKEPLLPLGPRGLLEIWNKGCLQKMWSLAGHHHCQNPTNAEKTSEEVP